MGEGKVVDVYPLKESVVVELDQGARREFMKHELQPLDELEAFRNKAEVGCEKHPDGNCDCGKKGIPGVVVISAGFREAGREGLERELELISIAKEYHIRLIGPNCLGVIDTFTPLNASFAAGTPPKRPMACMSQSGALGTAVLDIALAGRLGLSKFVSLGNKADVSEIDLLKAWKADENSHVILIYTEGMPNGQQFIETAREVTREKPIVAIKSGVTQSGSRAVSSHTGSLAGSEQAYRAAFRQAGILREWNQWNLCLIWHSR
jgi:acetyltransferase